MLEQNNFAVCNTREPLQDDPVHKPKLNKKQLFFSSFYHFNIEQNPINDTWQEHISVKDNEQ